MILLQERIGNDFTIKMHWKLFYYKNALQMILFENSSEMILS